MNLIHQILCDGNPSLFFQFYELQRQYEENSISANFYYTHFLKTYGIDGAPTFGEMISLLPNAKQRTELEVLYRKTVDIFRGIELRANDPKVTDLD